ncbi:MAG: DUF151 domain-containing protein [Bacteroidales bacterium]
MKRVRLDIGALTASPEDGGSFMFFLYREGMDICLPVPLTPPDMHAVLSNFKKIPDDIISTQELFSITLKDFRIELLEVSVVRDSKNKDFIANLLLFDGEKEVIKEASFIDGIILAKSFACPIYISEELMQEYSTTMELFSNEVVKTESHLVKLKEQLKEAINSEDYEKATLLSKEIAKFDNI